MGPLAATRGQVGALIDGATLVYAAAGDSCSLLGVPQRATEGRPGVPGKPADARTIELIPEHSPVNQKCWEERLWSTGWIRSLRPWS